MKSNTNDTYFASLLMKGMECPVTYLRKETQEGLVPYPSRVLGGIKCIVCKHAQEVMNFGAVSPYPLLPRHCNIS